MLKQGIKFLSSSLLIGLVVGCSSMTTNNDPAPSSGGMPLVTSTSSTVAYMKEGVDFSEYDKVRILPSEVAFQKNWQRKYNRTQATLTTRVNDDDIIKIKADMSQLFDKVFTEEFGRDASFPIVDTVSSNTLVIRPAIVDLDLVAPDIKSASHIRVYTQEKGEATLFLELYDGVTGEILARILDASVIGDDNQFEWSNRVNNNADAIRMIKKWAKALRVKFDEAHKSPVN